MNSLGASEVTYVPSDPDLVTVVIPCFNQVRFLPEAIESVLRQSHAAIEIVVVDDGSTDDTSNVAVRYPHVRCIRQENQGLAAARNTGLKAARGTFLVFLDADDRLLPAAIRSGLACLKNHPNCAFAYGRFRYVTADGRPFDTLPQQTAASQPYVDMLRRNFIAMHASVIFRRTIFDLLGSYNTALRACEDYELYLRITRHFPIVDHDELVAEYRQHGAAMTGNSALMLRSALRALSGERSWVQGNPGYVEAYHEGVRFWQRYYGEQLRRDTIKRLRARREGTKVLWGMYYLARFYPTGAIKLTKGVLARGGSAAYARFRHV